MKIFTYTILLMLLAACSRTAPDMLLDANQPDRAVHRWVSQTWQSPDWPGDPIDALDIWHGPVNQHWLFAVSGSSDTLLVIDAATGERVRRIAKPGNRSGELKNPTGVAVIDDYLLVAERGNRRVQVFTLPGLVPVTSFGSIELLAPSAIDVRRNAKGSYEVAVTDDYDLVAQDEPFDSVRSGRVKIFSMNYDGSRLLCQHLASMIKTSPEDTLLRAVGSIALDDPNAQILIADPAADCIRVYTTNGLYTGKSIGQEKFGGSPAGIAVCVSAQSAPGNPPKPSPQKGCLILADRQADLTRLLLYNRTGEIYLGTFSGKERLADSSAIAFTPKSFGPFPNGALFAVDGNSRIKAYGWAAIAEAMELN
jgi:3-phytase